MRTHLKERHKSVKLYVDTEEAPCGVKKQTSLVEWQRSTQALGQGKYSSINRSLAIMCGVDLRPISIVNGRGFKDFCYQLNPKYKVPSDTTVSNYVDLVYNDTKKKIVESVTGVESALTTDMWTSLANKGFITVTCHYISQDWKLNNTLLATRITSDRHTGVNIARELKKIVDEFGLGGVIALVTDNASNMVTAAEEGGYTRQPCVSHTLQLCINDSLRQQTVTKAVATAKRLVGHFSHSALATQALHDHQRKMGVNRPLSLIQDVATRWNSTFLMVERLLKLRVSIYGVLYQDGIISSTDRAQFDLKDSVWKLLEDMLVVLEPFKEATEIFSSASKPTISSVYVVLNNMLPRLEALELDSGAISELKKTLSKTLMKRFKVNSLGQPDIDTLRGIQAIATFLDPRCKSLRFMTVRQREQIQDHVIELLTEHADAHARATEGTRIVKQEIQEDPPVNPLFKKARLMDMLAPDVVDLTHDQPSSHEQELELYIAEPVHVLDPLLWWRNNEQKFPNLSKFAKAFLCVPATEVPSERSFSAAGATVTKLRASLSGDNVDKLTFIHHNYVFEERLPVGGLINATQSSTPSVPETGITAPPVVKTEPMAGAETPELPTLSVPIISVLNDNS